MRKRFLIIVSLAGSLFAETTAPERKIDDNAIISEHDPKLRIELPASVQYVGADRWILYEIADCELHAFVEADEQKDIKAALLDPVRRLYSEPPGATSQIRFSAACYHRRSGFLCRYLDEFTR